MKRGVGHAIAMLRSSSAEAATLRDELHAIARRKRRITVDGCEWELQCRVSESFGEDAFRVRLRRASQSARADARLARGYGADGPGSASGRQRATVIKRAGPGGGPALCPEGANPQSERTGCWRGCAHLRPSAELNRQAAGAGERVEMIRDTSRFDIPSASSDRIRRSSETDESPASILATRDWLDFSSLASSAWESPRCCRRSRRLAARRSFMSMYAASSSVSPRNSRALPTFQPFASRRLLFSSCTIVLPEPLPTGIDDGLGRRLGLLAEDLQDHNGIGIQAVEDSPGGRAISNPQFVTTWADRRHGPRVRHAKRLTLLQSPEQDAGLQSGRRGEGRRLDLSVKPDQRLVALAHGTSLCQIGHRVNGGQPTRRLTVACCRRPTVPADRTTDGLIARYAWRHR